MAGVMLAKRHAKVAFGLGLGLVAWLVFMVLTRCWLHADEPGKPVAGVLAATASSVPPAASGGDRRVSQPTLQAASGERLAADWADEFAQPTQALANRYKGQRIKVLGQVVDAQSNAQGILLLSLDAAPAANPLRLVMALGTMLDSDAFEKGQASVFECLHGGIMLGEPLLSDCQVLRR